MAPGHTRPGQRDCIAKSALYPAKRLFPHRIVQPLHTYIRSKRDNTCICCPDGGKSPAYKNEAASAPPISQRTQPFKQPVQNHRNLFKALFKGPKIPICPGHDYIVITRSGRPQAEIFLHQPLHPVTNHGIPDLFTHRKAQMRTFRGHCIQHKKRSGNAPAPLVYPLEGPCCTQRRNGAMPRGHACL